MYDLILLIGILIAFIGYLYWKSSKSDSSPPSTETLSTPSKQPPKKKEVQPSSSKKTQGAPKVHRHSLFQQEIKDGKYPVQSFAIDPNLNFIATVSEDKIIQLHYLVDKRTIIKHKLNNFANKICISSDGNYIVVALNDSKKLEAYHITKKGTTKTLEMVREFPNKHLKADIISLQMAKNNRFLITGGNDTTINVWSVKGEHLSAINTRQMQNYMACISPDSTMISAAAHMSDVRIWKFKVSKEDHLIGVEDKVFTYLRGHTSFIYWIAFSSDSKKLLSCSKDNTWKLWNLDVNYNIEELPKVIMSKNIPDNAVYTRVEISFDDNYFIALTDSHTSLHLWDLNAGELIDTIKSPHIGHITDITWFPKEEHKFVTSGTDGSLKIFDVHNRKL